VRLAVNLRRGRIAESGFFQLSCNSTIFNERGEASDFLEFLCLLSFFKKRKYVAEGSGVVGKFESKSKSRSKSKSESKSKSAPPEG
jgi:hypothetical protein